MRNVTVEELSHWFLQQLLVDVKENQEHLIHTIEAKIFSGQSGSSFWSKE